MYNRYIPQPDGSYRRNRMPDNQRQQNQHRPQEPQSPASVPPPPDRDERRPEQQDCRQEPLDHCPPPQRREMPRDRRGQSVGSFLKQLLPKDFDTGDLLIVLLFLLMAGDCAEDQNTALLTLVLYLFM